MLLHKSKVLHYIIIKVICTILLLACIIPVFAEEKTEINLKLYAKSAVLMDGESGRVLYAHNGYEAMPMASTTKILTCIVALENGNLEDEVTVSAYAASQPKVRLGMKQGQRFKLGDLLYSLMLESHNDSAAAIAEHVGGSVEGFAKLMNQKARDIGCFDSYFITPNGLDAKMVDEAGKERIHSTTAADLAKIMSYCIKLSPQAEKFLKITRTPNYGFSDMDGKRTFSCNNHNAFLNMMDGALSGKTGFTGNAGYCYVGALQRGEKTFIVALLACGWPNNKSYKWSDTKKLMAYGLDNFEYCEFNMELDQKALKPLKVENGKSDRMGQGAFTEIKAVRHNFGMLLKKDEKVEVVYEIPKLLTAPVKEGIIVGNIKYLVDGDVWNMDSVIAKTTVEKIDYKWCLEHILMHFIV